MEKRGVIDSGWTPDYDKRELLAEDDALNKQADVFEPPKAEAPKEEAPKEDAVKKGGKKKKAKRDPADEKKEADSGGRAAVSLPGAKFN